MTTSDTSANVDSTPEKKSVLLKFFDEHALPLEWLGCITAVIAALLVALNMGQMMSAYVFYLISSFAWIALGVARSLKGMITMQLILMGITLVGMYRYWE